jgi:hypothetical protein
MECFIEDLQHFLSEWDQGVWVATVNRNVRLATLKRTDEFPLTLEVHVSIEYPIGVTILKSQDGKKYRTKPHETISAAIDEALMEWNDNADDDDDAETDRRRPTLTVEEDEDRDLFATQLADLRHSAGTVSSISGDTTFGVAFDDVFRTFVVEMNVSVTEERGTSTYLIGACGATHLHVTFSLPPRNFDTCVPQLRSVLFSRTDRPPLDNGSLVENPPTPRESVDKRFFGLLKRILESNLRSVVRQDDPLVEVLLVVRDSFLIFWMSAPIGV